MTLLQKYMIEGKTLLGVGPVTRQVIEVANKISKKYEIPILLICSRRQVETEKLAKSYVMSTEEISKYGSNKYLYLSRDHGGPWQGIDEKSLSEEQALQSCTTSYREDINNNFKILHIDTCFCQSSKNSIFPIINFCENNAKKFDIIYEIGTDETNGEITNEYDFEKLVKLVSTYLEEKYSKKPLFVVAQTGTYVRECRQEGKFNFERTKRLCEIAKEHDVYLKEHNCDYIDNESFKEHNEAGVGAVNVAPEFGVSQTIILLETLDKISKESLQEFINYVVYQGKWMKWLSKSTSMQDLSDFDKCAISGHYHFEDNFVKSLIKRHNIKQELEILWYDVLSERIKGILKNLGWQDKIQ